MHTPKPLIYSLVLAAMVFLATLVVLGKRDDGDKGEVKKESVAIGYPEGIDILLSS